jgi:hypothetical protein
VNSAEYASLRKELEELKRLHQAEKTEHLKTKKALAEVCEMLGVDVCYVTQR